MEQLDVVDLVTGQALVGAAEDGRRCAEHVRGRVPRRGRIDVRVVGEHRLLQVAEPTARVDAQLVGQHPAGPAYGVEGVALPPAAVERQCEQRPPALVQRVLLHQPLQLGDGLGVAAQRELGLPERLGRVRPDALEPGALRLQAGRVGPVGEGLSPPQVQRLAQEVGRCCWITRGQLRPAAGGQVGERRRVEPVPVDHEGVPVVPPRDVAARRSRRPSGLERRPEPDDVGLEGLPPRRRR